MSMRKEVSALSDKEIVKLLRVKQRLDKKRPKFIRQESWRYVRVHPEWRRPRGIDSKMAEKRKGWPKMPTIGYRSPKLVRGYHPSGYPEVLVYNVKDLDGLDPNKVVVRIAHTVGEKKKIDIIERATELGLKIVNAPTFGEETVPLKTETKLEGAVEKESTEEVSE